MMIRDERRKVHVFIAARVPKDGVMNNPTENVVLAGNDALAAAQILGLV